MTNSTTTETRSMNGSRRPARHSDGAPMVVTRLSGWIDMSETKASTPPAWIIPTRLHARAR